MYKQARKSSEDAQATCNILLENTLSEHTLLENTLSEHILSEYTLSENKLL